jgi:hypothetical protein
MDAAQPPGEEEPAVPLDHRRGDHDGYGVRRNVCHDGQFAAAGWA